MIHAVLFDMDGVLLDLCGAHRAAFRAAVEMHTDLQLTPADEGWLEGRPTREKLKLLKLSGQVAEEVVETKQKLTQEFLDVIGIDRSKVELMNYLRGKGLFIGVYTNSISDTATKALGRCGVLPYVTHIVTNEDVCEPKPSTEGYESLMDLFFLDPDQVLIVEDSEVGIAAAVGTGSYVLSVESVSDVNVDTLKATLEFLEEECN